MSMRICVRQGNKLCEICRQPYKGVYKDPPSKAARLGTAAMMRGVAIVPHGLAQLSMSQESEVCLHLNTVQIARLNEHLLC